MKCAASFRRSWQLDSKLILRLVAARFRERNRLLVIKALPHKLRSCCLSFRRSNRWNRVCSVLTVFLSLIKILWFFCLRFKLSNSRIHARALLSSWRYSGSNCSRFKLLDFLFAGIGGPIATALFLSRRWSIKLVWNFARSAPLFITLNFLFYIRACWGKLIDINAATVLNTAIIGKLEIRIIRS